MELAWLESFLAVADCGGFTAAAQQVHRSQSRVSAHIADLERELGVRLLDRSHRPVVVTPAGRVFAAHARDVLAGVGSARATLAALRAIDEESLVVLTTPEVGAALFPGVLAALTGHHPDIRLVLVEHGEADWERRFSAGAPVVAVLPAQDGPIGPGRRESTLWREPMRVVVPEEHPLAAGGAVPLEWLARHPLIVAGTESARASDAMGLLHAAGIEALPRARVDTPQSLVAMARAGVGVGLAGAVALAHLNIDGLAVLDIAKPGLMRDVAAYWYEVLVRTELGRALLDAVLDAPLPPGAMPAARAPRRAVPAARK